MSTPWVHVSEHGADAKAYIHKRRTGQIRSLLTPWPKLNKELLNGVEWGSVIQLPGNSGSGKTLMKDQMVKGFFDLNRDQDFAALDFQFEMLGRTRIMRDVSRYTGKDLKTLSSAFSPISEEEEKEIFRFIDNDLGNDDIFVVDVPKNVPQIEKALYDFYNTVKKPIVASIDHSMLVERATEKDDFEVIRTLGKMLIRTKKQLPVIWIVLNQFNRTFEDAARQVPNSLSALPTKKDIYGGDSIYFASDAVIAISKPDMYLPIGSYYGPRNLGIQVTDNLMMWHVLKNRVGEPNMHLKMVANFKHMRVEDPSSTN
jgi:replicative DNA helicase